MEHPITPFELIAMVASRLELPAPPDPATRRLVRACPQAAILLPSADIHKELLTQWKNDRRGADVKFPIDQDKPDFEKLSRLLPNCWHLQFKFTLAKPVSTQDEDAFGPIDNMVRKEPATGIPCVAASSWKGALFAALQRLHPNWINNPPLRAAGYSLFGRHEAETEGQDHRRGHLIFYSTFFDRIGLYALHPLNRRTKTGGPGTPILYEVVPREANGWFSLLCCSTADSKTQRRQAGLISDAVATMLLQTGFGGKTSSGFGEAEDTIKGSLCVNGKIEPLTSLAALGRLGEQWST